MPLGLEAGTMIPRWFGIVRLQRKHVTGGLPTDAAHLARAAVDEIGVLALRFAGQLRVRCERAAAARPLAQHERASPLDVFPGDPVVRRILYGAGVVVERCEERRARGACDR